MAKVEPINPFEEYNRSLNERIFRNRREQNKERRQQTHSLTHIFGEVKARFREQNLSVQEIADNAKVDKELVEIFFTQDTVEQLSRIIQFAKIKISVSNAWYMKVYTANQDKDSVKIVRNIYPRGHIYYDKASGSFYNFHIKEKELSKSEDDNQLIINEMADYLFEFLKTGRNK